MKVFKMNDCDWVAAKDDLQAKQFYSDLTGQEMSEVEEEFEGEVSLNNTMYVLLNDLPEEELSMPQTMKEYGGETWVSKTFEWVIEKEKISEPCVISSTEY